MPEIKVTIDKDSGFCFGVKRAIEMAESSLDHERDLYCLGDIVHNKAEIKRLGEKGLTITDHENFRNLRSGKILFRAHGEPPSSYDIINRNRLSLIDATCPIVRKLQERVKKAWASMQESGGQVVIYGNPDHPEIIGLRGQTENGAIIVNSPSDISAVDPERPVELFSQTTKSTEEYRRLENNIRSKMQSYFRQHEIPLKVNNTICGQISRRTPLIRKFAGSHDFIVFVGGTQSSNAKVLFGHCRDVNPRSWFVSHQDEVKREWLADASTAGICGATSTPLWLMEKVAGRIRDLAGTDDSDDKDALEKGA